MARLKDLNVVLRDRMNDPCRNSGCEWFDRCELRPRPMPAAPPRSGALPAAPAPAPAFSVRDDSIGVLRLCGEIHDHTVAEPIDRMIDALANLRGLFVCIDSLGGTSPNGASLGLVVARLKVPVVGHVKLACSAALSPAATCSAVFIAPAAIMGRFGSVFCACDGIKRRLILSKGAPEKAALWSHGPPKVLLDGPETAGELQKIVDDVYERDLKWIAEKRGLGVDVLRLIMDGRLLDARQALNAGLVDGILTEAGALEILLKMAETGRKKLF